MKYKIYHGTKPDGTNKIGCTTTYPRRCTDQGLTNFYILEEYNDIYVASDREIELQKQYGYKIDKKKYHETQSMITFESRSKAGKKQGPVQGRKNVESGHWDKIKGSAGYKPGHTRSRIVDKETGEKIIKLYSTGNYKQSDIGQMFGFSTNTISRIVRGIIKYKE